MGKSTVFVAYHWHQITKMDEKQLQNSDETDKFVES